MYTMSNRTKSSLFQGMAALLAQIRVQQKCIEELRGELAFISFAAEHGDATAVACREELLSQMAAIEARLKTLKAALEEGESQAAQTRRRAPNALRRAHD
jgi:hypothetical protein